MRIRYWSLKCEKKTHVSLFVRCQIKTGRDRPSLEQLASHKNESLCAWKKCKGECWVSIKKSMGWVYCFVILYKVNCESNQLVWKCSIGPVSRSGKKKPRNWSSKRAYSACLIGWRITPISWPRFTTEPFSDLFLSRPAGIFFNLSLTIA